MKCLIVAGGNIKESFALPYMEEHSFDYRIAVDRGLDFFYQVNETPDCIVGDLDSANALAVEYYRGQKSVRLEKLNPMKNETDTEHAIGLAIELGASEIVILGGTGGRLDHFLGNVGILGIGLERGVEISLVDEYNRIRLINKKTVISQKEQYGRYISLIPFFGEAEGVTLTGMKYPLINGKLHEFHTLGISNEIVEEYGIVDVKKGNLILCESKE